MNKHIRSIKEKLAYETVDITPTWESLYPVFEDFIMNGSRKQKEHVCSELLNLCRVVDQMNLQRASDASPVDSEDLPKISVKESKSLPGPGEIGSVRYYLDDDDKELFLDKNGEGREELMNLLNKKKVQIIDNDLWVYEDDYATMKILDKWLDVIDSEEEDEEDYGDEE